MAKISRRAFLGKSAFGVGAALFASNLTTGPVLPETKKKEKLKIGFQVWTVREKLVKDFPGTLKEIASLGYETVEMCSPPGYADSGFGPLMKLSPGEMKKIINDAGLKLESTHYGMDELKNHLDERIEFAKESGQKQMILSSFWLPETASLDDWRKAADELNRIGRKTSEAGIQAGYHNHHMEFAKIDGTLIYDVLMKELDPDLVKMQFQVAVITLGYKASDYFKRYPGRFISAHLSDWTKPENKESALGQGVVDWKEFFSASKTAGLKNIFVEMEPETFKESAAFLHKII